MPFSKNQRERNRRENGQKHKCTQIINRKNANQNITYGWNMKMKIIYRTERNNDIHQYLQEYENENYIPKPNRTKWNEDKNHYWPECTTYSNSPNQWNPFSVVNLLMKIAIRMGIEHPRE